MKKSELRKLIKEELQGSTNIHGTGYFERMEGMANMQTLARVRTGIAELAADWVNEGFDIEDVIEYFKQYISTELY